MKPVIIITIAFVLFISVIIGLIIFIYQNNENDIDVEENLTKPSFFIMEAYYVWPDNYRKWDRNLSWDDFEIVNSRLEQPDYAARISLTLLPWYMVNVTMSTECNIEFLDTNATAIMIKDMSSKVDFFVTDATGVIIEEAPSGVYYHDPEYSLEHEQTHYNINEIGAINLSKSLKVIEGKNFDCNIPSGEILPDDIRKRAHEIIEPYVNNIINQTSEFDDLYDEKTKHGLDKDQQLIWNDEVEKALTELEQ